MSLVLVTHYPYETSNGLAADLGVLRKDYDNSNDDHRSKPIVFQYTKSDLDAKPEKRKEKLKDILSCLNHGASVVVIFSRHLRPPYLLRKYQTHTISCPSQFFLEQMTAALQKCEALGIAYQDEHGKLWSEWIQQFGAWPLERVDAISELIREMVGSWSPENQTIPDYTTRCLQKLTEPVLTMDARQEEILDESAPRHELYRIADFDKIEKLVEDSESDANVNARAFIKRTLLNDFRNQEKVFALSKKLLPKIQELHDKFPHFKEVIQHIENHCVLQSEGNGVFYLPPMLLAGGAGIGKTFFCHTVAEWVQTYFKVFHMESASSSFDLVGLGGGYSTDHPGGIFKALIDEPYINPIFLLDELDKSVGDPRHSPSNALLPLLERYTAAHFTDECIPLPLDASHVIWVATANDLSKMSAPLKSRFDVFTVPDPNFEQRRHMIHGIYLSILQKNTWGAAFHRQVPDEVLDILAMQESEGAVRDLRRVITSACAKAIQHGRRELRMDDLELPAIRERQLWDQPAQASR